MKVIIHNNAIDDSIIFPYDVATKVTEEIKQDVLSQVHARGWKDEDCWSEVEE